MTENVNLNNNLCKNCKHRFRRVFIPLKPESYVDEEGNRVLANDENIIITNQCLVSAMDLDGDVTVECDSYERRAEKHNNNKPTPFFKHLT
jgi:hypothetical protein